MHSRSLRCRPQVLQERLNICALLHRHSWPRLKVQYLPFQCEIDEHGFSFFGFSGRDRYRFQPRLPHHPLLLSFRQLMIGFGTNGTSPSWLVLSFLLSQSAGHRDVMVLEVIEVEKSGYHKFAFCSARAVIAKVGGGVRRKQIASVHASCVAATSDCASRALSASACNVLSCAVGPVFRMSPRVASASTLCGCSVDHVQA